MDCIDSAAAQACGSGVHGICGSKNSSPKGSYHSSWHREVTRSCRYPLAMAQADAIGAAVDDVSESSDSEEHAQAAQEALPKRKTQEMESCLVASAGGPAPELHAIPVKMGVWHEGEPSKPTFVLCFFGGTT